ncbi:MAG TPA: bifunctional diguanylate cyclase/phosphodiesterase, partial [Rubricoccaceae bacterium]
LPNRTRFRHRVEHAMYTRAPFAVLYVDLDRFKGVNDTLGHDAGDQLLLAVAARMRTAVGPDGTVARLGGDEFAALVPGDARAARRAARRVLAALADPVGVGPGTVVPTASVGVVVRAERYDDPAALLRDADTAMYEAKRAGRNRVSVFDAAMHEAARQRFGLGHDLREAVRTATDTPAASPFQLRFQPIVDLATGEVAGFESLVRWEHPALGLLGPSRFIPLAEEIGLVADIDGLVLEATCREVGSWGSPDGRAACEGLAMVSVNCSDQSLLRPGLAARARDAADAAGLPPGCLTLELTERALVDTDAALAAVHEIRAHGLQLCVDDFGSGYSSLGLLHRLPVDGLKVDRSFVADLDTSPAAQAVVRAVVQFSTDLGLRTVAEGIETPAQLRRLREAGCRYGQGFLFAPPVAPDVARAMLAEAPWAGRWPL